MVHSVRLSGQSLKRLREIVNGDSRDGNEIVSSYRSGPDLIGLFNDYGRSDIYGDGFPSRWLYSDQCLRELNGTDRMLAFIEEVFDPLEFTSPDAHRQMLDYINPAFERDGVKIVLEQHRAKLRSTENGPSVDSKHLSTHPAASSEFVSEHLDKCFRKLDLEDFSGAITNARSLVEAVLVDIEQNLDCDAPKYNGDLPKLQKRVNKILSRGRKPETDAVQQFLRGLESLVSGLAGTSNVMGDRHSGASVKPMRRHARLAVNGALALCDFYVEALQSFPEGR